MASQRVRVLYGGDVQGVGFRWRAVDAARAFQVAGFVRNLRDGRVELVAEGERAEVERFVAAVADRMAGHIGSADTAWSAPTGEFADFGVLG
jgi:acylphosphatase